jgi:hypothetical protein
MDSEFIEESEAAGHAVTIAVLLDGSPIRQAIRILDEAKTLVLATHILDAHSQRHSDR